MSEFDWSDSDVARSLEERAGEWPMAFRSSRMQEHVAFILVDMLREADGEPVPARDLVAEVVGDASGEWGDATVARVISEMCDAGVFAPVQRRQGRAWTKCLRVSIFGARWLLDRSFPRPVWEPRAGGDDWQIVFDVCSVPENDDLRFRLAEVWDRVGVMPGPMERVDAVDAVCVEEPQLVQALLAEVDRCDVVWGQRAPGVEVDR